MFGLGLHLVRLWVEQPAGGEGEGDGQDGDDCQDGEPDHEPADTSHQEDPSEREEPGPWQRQRDEPAGLGQVTQYGRHDISEGEKSGQSRPRLLLSHLGSGKTDVLRTRIR